MTFDEMKQLMEFVITSQANLTPKLDTISDKLETITDRLDTVTIRLDTVTTRLDTLTANVTRLEAAISETREQAEADRQETRKAINDLTTNIGHLMDTLAVVGFSHIDLKKQFGSHETRITALENH